MIKNLLLEPELSLKLILDHPCVFVILKIKQRQHELTLELVPYPGYFGSELVVLSLDVRSNGTWYFSRIDVLSKKEQVKVK